MIKIIWNTRDNPSGAIPIQFFTLPYSVLLWPQMWTASAKGGFWCGPWLHRLAHGWDNSYANSHSDFALRGLQSKPVFAEAALGSREAEFQLALSKTFQSRPFFKEPLRWTPFKYPSGAERTRCWGPREMFTLLCTYAHIYTLHTVIWLSPITV